MDLNRKRTFKLPFTVDVTLLLLKRSATPTNAISHRHMSLLLFLVTLNIVSLNVFMLTSHDQLWRPSFLQNILVQTPFTFKFPWDIPLANQATDDTVSLPLYMHVSVWGLPSSTTCGAIVRLVLCPETDIEMLGHKQCIFFEIAQTAPYSNYLFANWA
jgi:hypothetical protein